MMFQSDPPRLLDPKSGTPKLVRDAIRAGREDVPRPEQLERMSLRLAAAIQVAPVAGRSAAAALPARRGLWMRPIVKFGGPMLLVAGIGSGIWMAAGGGWRSAVFGGDVAGADGAMAESISADPSRAAPAPVQAPPAEPREPSPEANPESLVPPPPMVKPSLSRPPPVAPAPRPVNAPTSTETPAPSEMPVASETPSVSETPSAPMRAAADAVEPEAAPAAAPQPEPSESEASLLNRAQDDVENKPAAALALVAEHERRYASGMLVQEREVIAITALVRLGRSAEARARASAFRARYPGSAYIPRIDALLARREGEAAGGAGGRVTP